MTAGMGHSGANKKLIDKNIQQNTEQKAALGHVSVMKAEVIEYLSERYPGKFLDMTFGGGGHTRALLEGHPENKVVAIDCDPEAAPRAADVKKDYGARIEFIEGFFDEVFEHQALQSKDFDGVLMDLGVSSFQLDTAERGFSFRKEAVADMRMNPRVGMPAWEKINNSTEEELTTIVRDLGEEPRWRAVVKALINAQGTEKIKTTLGLSELISTYALKRGKLHAATRTFMGLRMAVNDELGRLERALPLSWQILKDKGILAVISFHSGEDRLVKNFFKGITRPKERAEGVLLQKGAGKPANKERSENVRARSAKLRVAQKQNIPVIKTTTEGADEIYSSKNNLSAAPMSKYKRKLAARGIQKR